MSEGFLFSRSSAGAEMSFPAGTGGTGGQFPRGLILCAGAVLGACRLRHSAAKVVSRITFTEKHNTKSAFLVSDGLCSLNGEYLACLG